MTATVRPPDGVETRIRARYLVAADGAGSFVRGSLGLEFGGSTYPDPLFVADVDLDVPLSDHELYLQFTPHGILNFFPMRGESHRHQQYRIISRVPAELADVELQPADIQRILDEHCAVDARVLRAHWISKYHVHRRMVSRFAVGRIFLVGDAAHVHSPIGGQGMNTGIQDGWNLAWKLALVVRGEAAAALLDSYHDERLPVARTVLNGTDRIFSLMASPSRVWHRARIMLLPVLAAIASRPAVSRRIFPVFSQIWISYRSSVAVGGDARASRARPGDRAPDAPFDAGPLAGRRVHSEMKGVEHHLLVFLDGAVTSGEAVGRLGAALDRRRLDARMHLIDGGQEELRRAYAVTTPTVVLVRPDGHIAWRGPAGDLEAMEAFLDRTYRRSAPGVDGLAGPAPVVASPLPGAGG